MDHVDEIDRDFSTFNSCNYSDSSYWNKRYADDPKPFDWYQCYAGVSPLVRRFIPLTSHVLMVGCGNAAMSEDMVKDGYADIVNIDISPVVIEAMQKKYRNIPQLKYMIMDALDMSSFDDRTFDAVIDKGTLDSIMCGVGAPFQAGIMLTEISRVLKPGGVYMLITYGDPRLRMPHLNRKTFGWNVCLFIIPQPGSREALEGCLKAYSEPVPLGGDDTDSNRSAIEDMESHFVYVCRKEQREELK